MSNIVENNVKPPVAPSAAAALETFLAEHRVQLVVDEHHRPDGFDFCGINGRVSVVTAPGFDPTEALAEIKPVIARWEADKVSSEQATSADRILTYPLHSGGFLSLPCPDWCTFDHTDDVKFGIHPVDLYHAGDEISLSFTTKEDERDVILSARIEQYPFGSEDGSDVPHMALMPVAGNGETLGHQSAAQVTATIRRVEKHLLDLRKLSEKLAEACATAHEQRNTSLDAVGLRSPRGWLSLRPDDIETMPVSYLLKAFDAGVAEVEPDETNIDGEISSVHADDLVILLRRNLTQPMRERAVRRLLMNRLRTFSPNQFTQVQA